VTDLRWGGPAAGPVVIDLGLMEHRPDEPEPVGAGPRPSPWLVVLLVLACCTVGLTAAGSPPPRSRLVFALDRVIEAPRFAGDTVLAYLDSDGTVGPSITAFSLADGAVRWRYRPVRRMAVMPAGAVTLISPAACRSMEEFVTEAVDAVSGDRRWRLPGAPLWTVAGGELAVFKQPVSGCSEATGGFDPLPSVPFVWAGVDLASGAVRWTFAVEAERRLAVGTDATGLATWMVVADSRMLTAYDLRTGAVVSTLEAPPEPSQQAVVRMSGAGDRLLLTERVRGALTVRAYNAPELLEAWRVTVPPPGSSRVELDSFTVRPCGPVVCMGPPAETIGLDAATGEERWRLPGRPLRVGSRYALFIRTRPGSGLPVFTVYDLATGATSIALPESQLVGRAADGVLLSIATGDGPGLWRVDLGTGAVRPLTTLSRLYIDCESVERHLACRATDGSFNLWRLPVRCPPACGATPVPADRRRT
jgi:PQQ-like domain